MLYAALVAAIGLVTAITFYRRQAPWLYSAAQIASTLALIGFIAGHWSLEVRYALGRWWLIMFILVLGLESFFLAQRLTALLPRMSGPEGLRAQTEVVLILGRGLFIAPAMVFGAAFAWRIWF